LIRNPLPGTILRACDRFFNRFVEDKKPTYVKLVGYNNFIIEIVEFTNTSKYEHLLSGSLKVFFEPKTSLFTSTISIW